MDRSSVPILLFWDECLLVIAMAQFTMRDSIELAPPHEPNRVWSIGSAASSLAAVIVSVIAVGVYRSNVDRGILALAAALLLVIAAFHVRFLHLARDQFRRLR